MDTHDFEKEFPELQGESCKSILTKVYAQNITIKEESDGRKRLLQITAFLMLLLLSSQIVLFTIIFNI